MKIDQILKMQADGSTKAQQFQPAANEVQLFGTVGEEIQAAQLANQLSNINGDVDINLFSGGGDLFEAAAIVSIIKQRRQTSHVRIIVHGLAASAGAFIAVSGDELIMEENAMLMIHNAWTIVAGNSNDLRDTADQIEKQQQSMVAELARQSGKDEDEIKSMLDEETWMTADEAIAEGFADGKFEAPEEQRVAAKVDDDIAKEYNFQNVPESVSITGKSKQKNQNSDTMDKAILKACGKPNGDASDVVAFITDLKAENKALEGQVDNLKADLSDKDELVDTLRSENEDLKQTNSALKESTKGQEIDALIEDVKAEAGDVELGEDAMEGLRRRAQRHYETDDEDRKADIKEDMIIFAEAKGVKTGSNGFSNLKSVKKNQHSANEGGDTDSSGAAISYEQKLMNKIEAIQEQNPDMSFDDAKAKAQRQVNKENLNGETPVPHSAQG